MKLSQQNRAAILKYYQDFFTKLSYPDIFKILRDYNFLSDYEFTFLNQCNQENMPNELVALLHKRNDSDFLTFCTILKNSTVTVMQELGTNLRREAKQIGKVDRSQSSKYGICLN